MLTLFVSDLYIVHKIAIFDGVLLQSALQPCTTSCSQDRFIVSHLDVPGGPWTFCGVFDGEQDAL